MKTAVTLILIFSCLSLASLAQEQRSAVDTNNIRLIFAGDIMGHGPQIQAALDTQTGAYHYDTSFYYIRPFLEKADFAFANLEVTLAGPPYSGYPHFSSPDALAGTLKKIGFNVLLMANNHAADRGRQGMQRTIQIIDSIGLRHTGTFRNPAERDSLYPMLLEKKGFRIAVLNYSYSTNGEIVPNPFTVNIIDTAIILSDLKKAQRLHPDVIITLMHWGKEYERIPGAAQKTLAHLLFRNGCNFIIGSHPHVIQPVEVNIPDSADLTNKQLVVYSLGNLVSNQRDRFRDGGIIFGLSLTKVWNRNVYKYAYLPVWVYKSPAEIKAGYYCITPVAYESDHTKIGLSGKNEDRMLQFFEDTRKQMENIPEMTGPDW